MKWVSKVPTVFLWMKILYEDKRTNLSIYSLYSPIFVDIYNYSEPVPPRHVRSRMCVILRPAWRAHHHDRDVNITYCFFQRFFRLRKESLSLHARSVTISKRNLFKLWDSAANDPNFFSTTVALFTNASRNRVDVEILFRQRGANRTSSSSYSIQKSLIIFSNILKAKYIFELWRWIANLPQKWKLNPLQWWCLSR